MDYTLHDFHRQFPDNETCLRYLFEAQYAEPQCCECGRIGSFHRHHAKRCFTCNCGRTQIYPQSCTIIKASPLPLEKWFLAVFLHWESRGNVTGKELERRLSVTYPTAWRVRRMIRHATEHRRAHSAMSFTRFLNRVLLENPED